jgi:ketosteroid isomerase-like protein
MPIKLVAAAAALVVTMSAVSSSQADPQALQRMVATERAFAAATAEIGVRDGFLSFFAADAVQIKRGERVTLTGAREALLAQAPSKLPIANQLIWEPFTGHVSEDGTLGWLTGGYVVMSQAQRTVVGQGAYFSVWKRQADGTWRVWLDEGINLPQIWQGAAPFRVAPDPDPFAGGAPNETLESVETSVAANQAAWRERLAEGVRLHVDGRMPLVGRPAVLDSQLANRTRSEYTTRTEAAGSGDLAVVIGGYEAAAGGASPVQRGSFVRVWKRDVAGRWRIVFQTETPA